MTVMMMNDGVDERR